MSTRLMNQAVIDRATGPLRTLVPKESTGDYLREIARLPTMAPDEDQSLGNCIKHGNRDEARKAHGYLIATNLRLVVDIAMNYVGQGLSLMDLIHEGNIGLIRAVNKFDYCRGYRFNTFASWWIQERIRRAISRRAQIMQASAYEVAKLLYLLSSTRIAGKSKKQIPYCEARDGKSNLAASLSRHYVWR